MARKRRSEEEEGGHENSERWLLTYSDMITLLLALFIIMYGMSTENQAKMQAMSQALSNAFNGPASEAGAGHRYRHGNRGGKLFAIKPGEHSDAGEGKLCNPESVWRSEPYHDHRKYSRLGKSRCGQ